MVTTDYFGRFANNLFQYVFARLIADKNGLKLETEWCRPDMIKFKPNPDGRVNTNEITLRDKHDKPTEMSWLENDYRAYKVHCHGYFQHPRFYDTNREKIMGWMELPEIVRRPDEIGCHLRLGDYDVTGKNPVIDQSWYEQILRSGDNRGKEVTFIVEKPEKQWEIDYVEKLSKGLADCKPSIVSSTPFDDFHLLRSFGTIVSSNSSFAWWAAFLSDAKKIYTFSRWLLNSPNVRLQYARRMQPVGGKYTWEK